MRASIRVETDRPRYSRRCARALVSVETSHGILNLHADQTPADGTPPWWRLTRDGRTLAAGCIAPRPVDRLSDALAAVHDFDKAHPGQLHPMVRELLTQERERHQ